MTTTIINMLSEAGMMALFVWGLVQFLVINLRLATRKNQTGRAHKGLKILLVATNALTLMALLGDLAMSLQEPHGVTWNFAKGLVLTIIFVMWFVALIFEFGKIKRFTHPWNKIPALTVGLYLLAGWFATFGNFTLADAYHTMILIWVILWFWYWLGRLGQRMLSSGDPEASSKLKANLDLFRFVVEVGSVVLIALAWLMRPLFDYQDLLGRVMTSWLVCVPTASLMTLLFGIQHYAETLESAPEDREQVRKGEVFWSILAIAYFITLLASTPLDMTFGIAWPK